MDLKLKLLTRLVGAPSWMDAWMDRFYEPVEIDLIAWMAGEAKPGDAIAAGTGMTSATLERSVRRAVLNRSEDGRYKPAGFHSRYDIWALFEGFMDLPADIRIRLNQWELDHYCTIHEKDLEMLRTGGPVDPLRIIPRYLLLDEALDLLDRVPQVFLWPCNCRSMIGGCRKPVYTCLRFDNPRGIGFEISRSKAAEIIRQANQSGLMQSGELGCDNDGRLAGAICNCCPDCCFPHLLAQKREAAGLWPFSRYVAVFQESDCSRCGRCARRCPFGAFVFSRASRKSAARLVFHPDQCRGCGLCREACPEGAIRMENVRPFPRIPA